MQKLSFPRGRLDDAIAMAWRAFERAGRLTSRVTPAVPILFFGDLDGYWVSPLRIVTVGLNPSRKEFGSFEPLLNGARSSYYGEQPSVALHTDICSPVATDPTWSRLHDVARTTLEADGGRLWHEVAARWYEVGDDPALFVFGPAARTPLGELATQQKRSAGAVLAQTWRRGC